MNIHPNQLSFLSHLIIDHILSTRVRLFNLDSTLLVNGGVAMRAFNTFNLKQEMYIVIYVMYKMYKILTDIFFPFQRTQSQQVTPN